MNATLLEGFLKKPSLNKVIKEVIDWQKTPLLCYSGSYAVVLDGLFTDYECKKLVEVAVAQNELENGQQWERAMINVGNYQQEMATDIRNNGRIIYDSVDIAARIWRRVAPFVPELDREPIMNKAHVTGSGPVIRGEVFRYSCLNERLRFLQYGPGEYFREHCDGCFVRPDDESEHSLYTLHLYLNEATSDNPLVGGATTFHHPILDDVEYDVAPKTGRVLIFQQRGLMHSGQEVDAGLKLTMRTDVMFRKTDETVPAEERALSKRGKSKAKARAEARSNIGAGNNEEIDMMKLS